MRTLGMLVVLAMPSMSQAAIVIFSQADYVQNFEPDMLSQFDPFTVTIPDYDTIQEIPFFDLENDFAITFDFGSFVLETFAARVSETGIGNSRPYSSTFMLKLPPHHSPYVTLSIGNPEIDVNMPSVRGPILPAPGRSQAVPEFGGVQTWIALLLSIAAVRLPRLR